MMKTTVVTGYRVIEPPKDGKGKPKQLSRTYQVKEAADAFVEQARRHGHPEATLETVFGADTAGPMGP